MPATNPAAAQRRLYRLPRAATLALQGALLYLSVLLAFATGIAGDGVAAIWPAAGVGVWMALFHGWRAWPAIFLGHAAWAFHAPAESVSFVLATSAGNALAICAASSLYRRIGGRVRPFAAVTDVLRFLLFLLAASAGAAGFAIVTMLLTGAIQGALGVIGWRWLFSDFCGALLVTPMLVEAFGRGQYLRQGAWLARLRRPAGGVLLSVFAIALLYPLTNSMPDGLGQYPAVLLVMPVCVWLALQPQPATGLALLCGVIAGAMALTINATGIATETGLLAVQLYGLVVMSTMLLLHARTREHRRALALLGAEQRRLTFAVEDRTRELRAQIAENERANRKLAALARTDELTSLPNRREFMRRAQDELRRLRRLGGELCVVMIDLDRFKSVNDGHGHAAGDAALLATAQVLEGAARHRIDLVARLGGEEFACLLPQTSVEEAITFAERVRQELSAQEIVAGEQRFTVTASFGVAEVQPQMQVIDTALLAADQALYRAKSLGRNRVEVVADAASARAGARAAGSSA